MSKWTSGKELPKESGQYLCMWDYGDNMVIYDVLHYFTEDLMVEDFEGKTHVAYKKGWRKVPQSLLDKAVNYATGLTAWMEIPPFEEKGEQT